MEAEKTGWGEKRGDERKEQGERRNDAEKE